MSEKVVEDKQDIKSIMLLNKNIYLPSCIHLHYKTTADHSIGPSA